MIYTLNLAGRELSITTGKMAELANAAVVVSYGETVVLVTATASDKPREGIDFFPLNVDYEERLYAVGKIPGSFIKREGKPSEKAVLTSRVIDRPLRPLFPSDLRNDVSVVALVLSVEQDNSPEIAAMIGAAAALSISDIPFNGPIGGISVGLVDDEIVINPDSNQRAKSKLNLTLAGSMEKIVMIEAGADQVEEGIMLEAIKKGHVEIKRICEFVKGIQEKEGKPKFEYESCVVDEELYKTVAEFATDKLKVALDNDDKKTREVNISKVYDEVFAEIEECYPVEEFKASIEGALYKLQKSIVRKWLLEEGKRSDGRKLDEMRKLSSEVAVLPRVHGSGLFARGQTQVLTVATLGPLANVQVLDGIDTDESKRYMHHYNFPSYSVGETRPSRGPGRREIGHGALAERALEPVIPDAEEFPYAIRVVSEVLSSNGSTSQGSVCGSTLALMDAGVPIKAPVAGISVGLVSEGDKFVTMLDIQGLEDFFGDMDFKVAGTHKGITAIQVDIKTDGLTYEIIEKAFEQTKTARKYILDEVMLKAIPSSRPEVSKYAPKVIKMMINPDKIREVIGAGGKVIQEIVADTGAKIDIEDDGRIIISCVDIEAGKKAVRLIEAIVKDLEVGQILVGKVMRIVSFGAFVKLSSNKEGMVHISKLDQKRVEKVEDVVNIGDEILVKVVEIDRQGRINLSRKDALLEQTEKRI